MPHNVGGHCYTVNITKGKLMEKTIAVPVSTLEWLAEQNEADVIMYREAGIEGMASWCEGRAHGYRTLLEVYGS
jgi:hypothetical protein